MWFGMENSERLGSRWQTKGRTDISRIRTAYGSRGPSIRCWSGPACRRGADIKPPKTGLNVFPSFLGLWMPKSNTSHKEYYVKFLVDRDMRGRRSAIQ